MSTRWTPYKIEQLEALLSERDSRILEDIERYRAVTTRLIQRLHFPAGPHGMHSTTRTATRLTNRVLLRLEAHGFIARIDRRVGGALRGSAAMPWHLAAAGERLLRARRGEAGRRRYVAPSRAFLSHTLGVAEFATQCREAAATGAFDILELHPEPACWRPFQAAYGTTTLKPDLYVVIANQELEAHAFIEIDRGTEHLPAVVKKCRTYQQYRQTGSEQARTGVFPAVLWIVPDADRASKLRNALRHEPGLPTDLFTISETARAIVVLAGLLDSSTAT